jgi:hypothetical protein
VLYILSEKFEIESESDVSISIDADQLVHIGKEEAAELDSIDDMIGSLEVKEVQKNMTVVLGDIIKNLDITDMKQAGQHSTEIGMEIQESSDEDNNEQALADGESWESRF